VRYQNNKQIILKHIDSADPEAELDELIVLVGEWMKDYSNQLSIFPDENPNKLIHLNHRRFIGFNTNFFIAKLVSFKKK